MKLIKRGQKRTKNVKKRDAQYLRRRKGIYAEWRAEAPALSFVAHIWMEHQRRLDDDCIEP